MNPELERHILACPTLPTLPAVALEVMRLCHADEIDLCQIADALASDPALTAQVLRAANSVSLAARGKVGTLTRAVPLLGSKAVVALALSFSLVRGRRRDDAPGFDRAAFWRRAVFAALAGRTLAEGAAPSVDPEEAFVAALLQDLGMLALWEVFRREYGPLCARAGGDHRALTALERNGWGADHAEVSALLARSWRLPAPLERALGASHGGPGPGAAPAEARLVECVALSGLLADVWVAPHGGGAPLSALEPACRRLRFDPGALEAAIARMALAVPETSADFDIDLGGPGRVEEVLAKARGLCAALGPAISLPETEATIEEGEALNGSLRFAFECARRRREPLTLLLFSCEPPASEGAGAALIPALRHWVRATDLLGRTGRGDALLLLPNADVAGGRAVAERVLHRAARSPGLALSVGIAGSGPPAPTDSLERLRAAVVEELAAARAWGGRRVSAVEVGSSRTGGAA